MFVNLPGRFDSHHRPRGVHGGGMLMVSVFFADTVKAKARQSSTMTMQASSAYSMPRTARRRTYSIAGSGPIDIGDPFRCSSSARMTVSSLDLRRTTVSTAASLTDFSHNIKLLSKSSSLWPQGKNIPSSERTTQNVTVHPKKKRQWYKISGKKRRLPKEKRKKKKKSQKRTHRVVSNIIVVCCCGCLLGAWLPWRSMQNDRNRGRGFIICFVLKTKTKVKLKTRKRNARKRQYGLGKQNRKCPEVTNSCQLRLYFIFLFFLVVVFALYFLGGFQCSRWSFVDVPLLFFFCPVHQQTTQY